MAANGSLDFVGRYFTKNKHTGNKMRLTDWRNVQFNSISGWTTAIDIPLSGPFCESATLSEGDRELDLLAEWDVRAWITPEGTKLHEFPELPYKYIRMA